MNAAAEKTGGKPTDEQQEQMNALSDDVAVLQEDLQRLLGEAEGITCANPRVVISSTFVCALGMPVCG